MMGVIKRAIAVLAVVAGLAGASHAAVLYTNGGPNGTGGSNMSDTLQAQDFTLASAFNLTGLRFFSPESQGAYTGQISFQILANAFGAPGATVIGSGLVTPTRTFVGTSVDLGLDIYQYDLAVSLLNLAAGTYWLALHNGPLATTAFSDFYWAWADDNGTIRGMEMLLDPLSGVWTTNAAEHAFLVSGERVTKIPEPGTLLLAALPLALLARRRFGRA